MGLPSTELGDKTHFTLKTFEITPTLHPIAWR